MGQCVLGSLSPWVQTGFLNRNCRNADMGCLHQASSSQLSLGVGGGGVSFSPPHRLHSREPSSGPGWGGASAHYAGHSGGYLALVKLVHSLCDPITVIQPHHAGKPGDEASIPWDRKRSACCPRSPSPPTCSLGCQEACPGSLMPLNFGQMGRSGQALQPWGSWAPGRKRRVAALTVILPRLLGAWGVGVPPQALGTHLRWPCVGSCWGGPAGAACGTCLHLVSPAGGLGVGTRSSCSDIAGMGRGQVTSPAPTWVWLG